MTQRTANPCTPVRFRAWPPIVRPPQKNTRRTARRSRRKSWDKNWDSWPACRPTRASANCHLHGCSRRGTAARICSDTVFAIATRNPPLEVLPWSTRIAHNAAERDRLLRNRGPLFLIGVERVGRSGPTARLPSVGQVYGGGMERQRRLPWGSGPAAGQAERCDDPTRRRHRRERYRAPSVEVMLPPTRRLRRLVSRFETLCSAAQPLGSAQAGPIGWATYA